jgi:hypothetical protein
VLNEHFFSSLISILFNVCEKQNFACPAFFRMSVVYCHMSDKNLAF